MKLGDLVKSTKSNGTIGIVVEIFDDLGEQDPWIRVLFTHPLESTFVLQPQAQLPAEGTNTQAHPPVAPGETSVLHGDTQHAAMMSVDNNERYW